MMMTTNRSLLRRIFRSRRARLRSLDSLSIDALSLESDLQGWYRHARPVLLELATEDLLEIEGADESDSLAVGRDFPSLEVCVVGPAGVGKSTLINTLIGSGMSVIPAGGVGPHTASKISVRYSEEPFFQAKYRCEKEVDELARSFDSSPDSLDLARGRLLLSDGQFSAMCANDLAMRLAEAESGGPYLHLPSESPQARGDRLARAIKAIRSGRETLRVGVDSDMRGFVQELKTHASGFLAPLTESITIGWRSPQLEKGVVLVDLPGLGIANDYYAGLTKNALDSARAALWVVERSGLTADCLTSLQKSGILNGLGAKTDSACFSQIAIAVSKLDLIALDERRARGRGQASYEEALAIVREDAQEMIKAQLRAALVGVGSEETRGRALSATPVAALSPVDYDRIIAADQEEPARVESKDSTGVPELARILHQMARLHRENVFSRLSSLLAREAKSARRRDRPALRELHQSLSTLRAQ
jgi:hypothetical protein